MKKLLSKQKFKRTFFAYSLVEIMISLIIISTICAAVTPVVTRKMAKDATKAGEQSDIVKTENECSQFNQSGGKCHVCYKKKCLVCEYDFCDKHLNQEKCACE